MSWIPAAVTGGVGLAQGIAGAVPSAFDKKNKGRISELELLQKKGMLGLTDAERQSRERDLMDPQRAAMTQASTDQARLMAQANGGASAGDLSRLRSETSRGLGDAAAKTATYLDQANEQKAAQQTAELESRRATQEGRRAEHMDSLFSGMAQAASAAGGALGQVPEFSKAAGFGGGSKFNPRATMENLGLAGVPQQHAMAMTSLLSQPDAAKWVRQAAAGKNLQDPNVAYIRQLMADSAANQMAGATGPGVWGNSDAMLARVLGNPMTGG